MVATQTLFFQKLAEMTDVNYLKSYLTYLVSPVITGIKPLSLLNLQNNHRPLVLMWEQEGEDFLQKHQLEQYVVKKSNKTLKLFIYNKSILERYLRKPHNLHFLRQFGYSGNAPLEEYLSYLKIRWKDSTFPHESGLFMGIPIKDIQGYLGNKTPIFQGYWLVYSDEKQKRDIFHLYDQSKMLIMDLIMEGREANNKLKDIFSEKQKDLYKNL